MHRAHSQPPDSEPSRARRQRAQEIAAECVQRRIAGEQISNADLLARHPELQEELSDELRKLDFVQAAVAQAVNPEDHVDRGQAETLAHFSTHPAHVNCPSCHEPVEIDFSATGNGHAASCSACGTSFSVTMMREAADARQGEMVAHFQLLELVGTGGFGSVWRAADTKLDRIVALKLPRARYVSDPEAELFMREARTSAQLKHPNIVRVHEVGRDHDTIFIVTDLIDGRPLSQVIVEDAMTMRDAAVLCEKVARAMQYAHEQGVIHRDLKPQNILIDRAGEPFITDFGLARRDSIEVTMTVDGAILGTPVYMPPEQAGGDAHQADARSDVYSIGVTLYQLLTGELPFRGSAANVIRQVMHDEPTRPRKLSAHVDCDLETICLHAMEKNPAQRYQTARTLADDLGRWLQRKPIQARPVNSLGRFTRWCRRKPAIAALMTLLVVVTAGAFAAVTWQWRKAETALVEWQAAKARADRNKESAWDVIDEFLVEVARVDLANEPRMGAVRERLLERATDHLDSIAESNNQDPQSMLDAASAYYRLGCLKGEHGEIEEGMEYLQQGLDICETLKGSELEQPYVTYIEALLHLARVQVGKFSGSGQVEVDATAELTLACDMLNQILSLEPDNQEWLRHKADAISKLGSWLRQVHDPDALEVLEEAATAWQLIIDANPDDASAMDYKSRCLLDTAHVLVQTGKPHEAIGYGEEALNLIEQALALLPQDTNIRGKIPTACYVLGLAYHEVGDWEASAGALQRGVAAREQLASDFPKFRYHRDHLATLNSLLSQTYSKLGRHQEALDCLGQVIAIYEQLLEEDPDAYDYWLYRLQNIVILADAYLQSSDYERAAETYQSALAMPLRREKQVEVRGLIAYAGRGYSRALAELGRTGEAVDAAREAIEHLQPILANEPNLQWQLTSVELCRTLVIALHDDGQLENAAHEAETGLAAALKLQDIEAAAATHLRVLYLLATCEAEYDVGRVEEALKLFKEELSDLTEAPQTEPNPQRAVLKGFVEVYTELEDADAAQEWQDRLDKLPN